VLSQRLTNDARMRDYQFSWVVSAERLDFQKKAEWLTCTGNVCKFLVQICLYCFTSTFDQLLLMTIITRKLGYRKDDRAMRAI